MEGHSVVVDLEKIPNKRGVEEQESGKRKILENLNDVAPIPNKPNIENMEEVEDRVESEESQKIVNENVSKIKESLVSQSYQSKYLPHSCEGPRRRGRIPSSRSFSQNLKTCWLTFQVHKRLDDKEKSHGL